MIDLMIEFMMIHTLVLLPHIGCIFPKNEKYDRYLGKNHNFI